VYGRKPRQANLSAEQYEAVREFPRQALHAAILKLRHPADDRSCTYRSPLAVDLRDLLGMLGVEKTKL
jgi:23S rRNA pseudouridine1911/1915/1917 synthase